MNLGSILSTGLDGATPLLLASLGGVLSERSGVVNIGLEGLMLAGAFGAAVGAHLTGSAVAGVALGIASSVALAMTFAWLVVAFRADQIVAGIGINLISLGATSVSYRALFGDTGSTFRVAGLPRLRVAGDFSFSPWLIVALAIAGALALFLHRTRRGLCVRACGEMPCAAATSGFSVELTRYATILWCGVLCGAAGADLVLTQSLTFVEGMTAGRGFLAIAIIVFGNWKPAGVLAGSLLFGILNTLQFQLQAAGLQIPYQFPLMLPYALSLALLAGIGLRSRPPAALGVPYRGE